MATIKAIEARSVHQIQSGQVIVDLCSVVKELVENSLDAGATSIEIRFKNYGLDSIEVVDNGSGISHANYENIALKHHTSKLSNYDDLAHLQTFGFRGEALSSLCALCRFFITTAQAHEAPKGTHLEFAQSGALKSTSTVASQKGTSVTAEGLFENLPVRRKELSKNIKREYGKVLGLLHAYACIGTHVKFIVKNAMPKGKSVVVFSTKGNATTRENIANVYGSKTLSALVPLDLKLDFDATPTPMAQAGTNAANVIVQGHISKPVFGEGRQTPDRQMFFVNGRPCGLPQIAKAMNEVYRSFNVSQSPFIFADFRMDTNSYDVNVSPDKRSIMLHNATTLIERLRSVLTEMFDNTEQTVPQSQFQTPKLPTLRPLSLQRQDSTNSRTSAGSDSSLRDLTRSRLQDARPSVADQESDNDRAPRRMFHDQFRNLASTRDDSDDEHADRDSSRLQEAREKRAENPSEVLAQYTGPNEYTDEFDDFREPVNNDGNLRRTKNAEEVVLPVPNARLASQQQNRGSATDNSMSEGPDAAEVELSIGDGQPSNNQVSGVVQQAFDRMRAKRLPAKIATITVGDETTTEIVGTQFPRFSSKGEEKRKEEMSRTQARGRSSSTMSKFSQTLRKFDAAQEHDARSEDHVDEAANHEFAEHESEASDVSENPNESESGSEDSYGDPEPFIKQQPAEMDEEEGKEEEEGEEEDDDDDQDGDYVDEHEKREQEEVRVAELIRAAEQDEAKIDIQRVKKALNPSQIRDSTAKLLTMVDVSTEALKEHVQIWKDAFKTEKQARVEPENADEEGDEEARLSLTVSKQDFGKMQIVGQFNLGFIITVRPATTDSDRGHGKDELFIVDQHASDEKYNFERLQAETTVGNQRMVKPVTLSLTAVEEEIVLENSKAVEKNGFIVDIDTSGVSPVGRRCTLTSLPLSKEVVFDTRDLDELIHLISESATGSSDASVPRPSRVRKMFAMRACRSSIMIGKTLSKRQMRTVVDHMGTIDKPWNCPHGRPTMRHLSSLSDWKTWQEGDGVDDTSDEAVQEAAANDGNRWKMYMLS